MTERDTHPGLLFGYARVSTQEQNLQMQVDALVKAGVDPGRIFSDQMSGASNKRPGFAGLKKAVRKGDTVVVWKLDRLGRSAFGVLETIREFTDRGVDLNSLTQNIDGRTSMGRFMIHILAGLAEMERELGIERTKAGLEAAKARGVKLGKADSMTPEKATHADQLLDEGVLSKRKIADAVGVSRTRLYTYAAARRKEKQG